MIPQYYDQVITHPMPPINQVVEKIYQKQIQVNKPPLVQNYRQFFEKEIIMQPRQQAILRQEIIRQDLPPVYS
jgi:hypothetical protein